jgi:hypothetical protein
MDPKGPLSVHANEIEYWLIMEYALVKSSSASEETVHVPKSVHNVRFKFQINIV